MKKQKITIGAILEIKIENNYYYAQILGKSACVFFDFFSDKQIKDFSILRDKPILFIIAVYNDIITNGHWLKVGNLEIREELKVLPMQFIQDTLKPDKYELYNPNNGEISPASKQECIGLECAAVWEAKHVEERILDFYAKRPNIWVEKMKVK